MTDTQTQTPTKKPIYKRWWFWLAVVVVIAIAANSGASDEGAPAADSEQITEQPAADAPAEEAAPEPPAEPEYTVAQENALEKAEDYLDFSSFSRSGLIEQLEFEGFATADATWAVDHLAVDWNEQAAKKAKEYMDMTAFSRSGLIEQLEFEGFTREQAEHGANSVGL